MSNGRGWAVAGFWTGIGASVSANIAHAYVGHLPAVGAVLAASFWPMALLISIEIISRVDWPAGRKWWLLRYGGLTTVALIAAIISYSHMVGLLGVYGEGYFTAHIGPLAIDGLMIVSSTALLAIADNARRSLRRPEIVRLES